ncbi:MAG TPA: hypothetical protein VGO62_18750 [Myxococcota bacterium]
MSLTRVGAVGMVSAATGALALPIGVMLVLASDATMPAALLPIAPALVLVIGGALALAFGRRARRRR